MGWLSKIFKNQFSSGKIIEYAAHPSPEQVMEAKAILQFVASSGWSSYQTFLERDFYKALVACFDAVEKGNFKTLPLHVMRAQVRYELINKISWAKSIMMKTNQESKPSTTG